MWSLGDFRCNIKSEVWAETLNYWCCFQLKTSANSNKKQVFLYLNSSRALLWTKFISQPSIFKKRSSFLVFGTLQYCFWLRFSWLIPVKSNFSTIWLVSRKIVLSKNRPNYWNGYIVKLFWQVKISYPQISRAFYVKISLNLLHIDQVALILATLVGKNLSVKKKKERILVIIKTTFLYR